MLSIQLRASRILLRRNGSSRADILQCRRNSCWIGNGKSFVNTGNRSCTIIEHSVIIATSSSDSKSDGRCCGSTSKVHSKSSPFQASAHLDSSTLPHPVPPAKFVPNRGPIEAGFLLLFARSGRNLREPRRGWTETSV